MTFCDWTDHWPRRILNTDPFHWLFFLFFFLLAKERTLCPDLRKCCQPEHWFRLGRINYVAPLATLVSVGKHSSGLDGMFLLPKPDLWQIAFLMYQTSLSVTDECRTHGSVDADSRSAHSAQDAPLSDSNIKPLISSFDLNLLEFSRFFLV